VKAVKNKDADKASTFWVPDQAESWRVATADSWDHMKANATELYFDRIPADPAFGAPVTTPAGLTTIQSGDKSLTLEMKQIGGNWYVAKM